MHSYDIVADVFKYNKVPIMIVTSLFCIISAFTNLNTITGLFSIFFILAIYFDLININLFKKIIPLNLSYPIASNQVALKTSIVGSIPFLSLPEDSSSTSTEKKALMTGGSKSNFIKKLNKIVSR
jgi:hypothetical protein